MADQEMLPGRTGSLKNKEKTELAMVVVSQ
jgi:hypothetical protein